MKTSLGCYNLDLISDNALLTYGVHILHHNAQMHWSLFKKHFRKVYRSEEEHDYRFQVFKTSMARVHQRNLANVAAGGQHVFGVTRFSDETQEEFNRRYKGRKDMVSK